MGTTGRGKPWRVHTPGVITRHTLARSHPGVVTLWRGHDKAWSRQGISRTLLFVPVHCKEGVVVSQTGDSASLCFLENPFRGFSLQEKRGRVDVL